MINPYVGRCCNPKCRKTIYLRTQSLFDLYSKTPISILKYIVTLSLIHSKNTNEIYDYLSKSCESTAISKNHILNILKTMRELIAKYLDDTYKREYIAEENGQDSISVDESLFVHNGQIQVWVVGLINNRTREIRLVQVENRTSFTIKNIITGLIPRGNIIITDGALCYNWLDEKNSSHVHHIHNH